MRLLKTLMVLSPLLLFAPLAWSTTVPSSPRSIEVIARATPALTPELKKRGLEMGSPVFIRIFKESNDLEVWVRGAEGYQHFKTYKVCFFSGGLGPKLRMGDRQGPEGFYSVTPDHMLPLSQFHVGLLLDYPNRYDQAHKRTGSAIVIHGDCVSIGCYAMSDPSIEEIYTLADAALRKGQPSIPVHIFPFRMTEENLERYHPALFGNSLFSAQGSKWIGFWRNLKEGYDLFEERHSPPQVTVRNKRYVFK